MYIFFCLLRRRSIELDNKLLGAHYNIIIPIESDGLGFFCVCVGGGGFGGVFVCFALFCFCLFCLFLLLLIGCFLCCLGFFVCLFFVLGFVCCWFFVCLFLFLFCFCFVFFVGFFGGFGWFFGAGWGGRVARICFLHCFFNVNITSVYCICMVNKLVIRYFVYNINTRKTPTYLPVLPLLSREHFPITVDFD